MAPLTDNLPKPMITIAGQPLVDYAIDLVRDAGLTRVFANTHHRPEALEDHLRSRGVVPVREDVLLETGGGLKNVVPLVGDGPVLILNSDAIWPGSSPLRGLLESWRSDMGALLSLTDPNDAIGYRRKGDFLANADAQLSRGPGLIYNGAHITWTKRLAEIDAQVFSLNRLWDLMLADQSLYGVRHQGLWCDVGHPESIALAEAALNV